jgi:hypothetical protein
MSEISMAKKEEDKKTKPKNVTRPPTDGKGPVRNPKTPGGEKI